MFLIRKPTSKVQSNTFVRLVYGTKNVEDGANCHRANSNNDHVEWTPTMDTIKDEKCWLFVFFQQIQCFLRRYTDPNIAHVIQCVLEFSIEIQIDSIWSRTFFFSKSYKFWLFMRFGIDFFPMDRYRWNSFQNMCEKNGVCWCDDFYIKTDNKLKDRLS